MDQARGIHKRGRFIDRLFDIHRDLDGLLVETCACAVIRSACNAGGLVKATEHLRQIGLDRLFGGLCIHGLSAPFATTHACRAEEVERKSSNLVALFEGDPDHIQESSNELGNLRQYGG